MYKILRIAFCLLAATCAAVTVFIFVYFGIWGIVPLTGAVVSALLMFICKNAQEREERKNNPTAPTTGDFITGKLPSEPAEKNPQGIDCND